MKQFQRGHSNTKAAADVVDLLDSDDEEAGQPQQKQQQGQMQHQGAAAGLKASSSSPGGGRASIRSKRATAATTTQKLAQAQAVSEYAGDYEFISDDDPDDYQPPKQQKQQQHKQQQPAAPKQVQLMRNHFAPSQLQQQQQHQDGPQDGSQGAVGTSTQKQQAPRKPASTNNKRDAAAAGTMQPPAKRAKGSAAGRKAAAGKAGTAAGSKQTTLQSKGFGSLCFSMSQPAAGGGGGFAPLPLSSSQGMSSQEGPVSPAQPARSATPQPPAAPADDAQWVDKHQPQALDELIVHKRKVSEVQAWLQGYLDSRAAAPSRALLITGPSGCGKSVTLRVLANALGFEVVEWNAPVPTLWSDYQYQAGAGVGYTSKLDEFDMFVTRCKFAALPLACSTANSTQQEQQQASQQQCSSQQPSQQQQQQRQKGRLKLLLVEDLPYVGEPSRRARLAATLQDLATTARCPVVVVATTEEGSSSGMNSSRGAGGYGGGAAAGAGASMKGLHKDILAVLDKIGAGQISFNAITANNITKALHTIADKEGFVLQQDVADGIAQAAAGDLRNAIQSFQLMHMQQQGAAAMNCKATKAAGKGKGKAKAPKRPRRVMPKDAAAIAAAEAAKQKVAGQVSRDQHLSVFHAVGKILHYKRNQPEDAAATQQQMQQTQAAGASDVIDLCEADAALQTQGLSNRHWRPPLRVDPEGIIQGSGLEALQVTAFLAENYPHFIADDAMEEAAAAAAYISDAGYLACHRNTSASSSGFWDEADTVASSVQQAAAGSIAARGLLFSNIKPAPSRWLPVRGSGCFQPEKAAAGNLQKLGEAVQQLQDSWAAAGALQQQAVMQLAAQLLHAGRQERASQVLPYLQVLCKHHSRMWVHQLLPRSWCYVWGGQVTERQSAAIQGPQAAAALQAAVAAAAATADTGMDPAWPDAANQGDPDGSDDQIEEDSE